MPTQIDRTRRGWPWQIGAEGEVLKVVNGWPTWDVDATAGGGAAQLPTSGGVRRSAARKPLIEFSNVVTSAAPSPNNYMFWPFVVGRNITLTALGIELTSISAGNRCRCAIYSNAFSSGNDSPGDLIVQTADISTATPSGYKSASVSATLNAGTLYWLGFVCSAGSFATRSGELPLLGRTPDANLQVYTALSASAAGWTQFPATAPAVTPSTLVGYKVVVFFEE